ncbi:UNVERIFIED_CONTAM: hypothetical protein Scaly_0772900 [Sesamum calycinum]|uniref:Ribosomal protein L34e superfamily protein n=1 Tax=Sesamum calycinum TaxID=2727403 RepID=A0AAW2RA27_9LAMI
MEFDLQLQGEDMLRIGNGNKAVKDVDELPWKGGSEDNPDYECLRAELRKMAPPNGRAVLLFRDKCGCPVSKLEGWGPKRGRRHKKVVVIWMPYSVLLLWFGWLSWCSFVLGYDVGFRSLALTGGGDPR